MEKQDGTAIEEGELVLSYKKNRMLPLGANEPKRSVGR